MVTTRKGTTSEGAGAAAPRRGRGRGRGKRAKAEAGEAGDDAAAQATATKRAKTDDEPQAARPEERKEETEEERGGERTESREAAQPEAAASAKAATEETKAATEETKGPEAPRRQEEQPEPLPEAHATIPKKEEEEAKQEEAPRPTGEDTGAAAGRAGPPTQSRKSSFPPGHKPVVLERGHIFFFYRPKVEHETVSSPDEVQRMHMVLKPQPGSSVGSGLTRLLLVAKKRLPAVEGRKETIWCFVRKVWPPSILRLGLAGRWLMATSMGAAGRWALQAAKDEKEVMSELEAYSYSTATRGERHQEAARPYANREFAVAGNKPGRALTSSIDVGRSCRVQRWRRRLRPDHARGPRAPRVLFDGTAKPGGTEGRVAPSHPHRDSGRHFRQRSLQVPLDPGEVQDQLNIRREASYIVQVKNPENPERQRNMPSNYPGFEGLGERGRPEYPEELMVGFENLSSEQHKRFTSNEDLPKFMDVVGTELLLIGAKADVVGELRGAQRAWRPARNNLGDAALTAQLRACGFPCSQHRPRSWSRRLPRRCSKSKR